MSAGWERRTARQVSAIAAATWCAAFGVVHVYWALGGPIGLPSDLRLRDHAALFATDLVAIPLCFGFAWVCIGLKGYRLRRLLLVFAGGFSLVHSLPVLVGHLYRVVSTASPQALSEREGLAIYIYEPFWLLGGLLLLLAAQAADRQTPAPRP